MNTDLVKDILLKAAEDVQSGKWCTGLWFEWSSPSVLASPQSLLAGHLSIDDALASRRCAMGSLAVATKLLGGTEPDLHDATRAANRILYERQNTTVIAFNDSFDDPFEAGQQLAELFRSTAEAL